MMPCEVNPQGPPSAARFALGVAVFTWGVQAIVGQSLLLREALVLMSGNEFAWGVVLFAWLLGVALGAGVGGWVSRQVRTCGDELNLSRGFGIRRRLRPGPEVCLAAALIALSIVLPLQLWAFRAARGWLGISPGELLPLTRTAVASMGLIPPASLLIGMAFPLACAAAEAFRSHGPAGGTPLGRVYAIESAGGLVGGAVFSFWAIERLNPVQIALLCGGATIAAAALLLAASHRRRWVAGGLAAAAGAATALAVGAGDTLNRLLVERRWRDVAPGYALLAECDSKYQNLALGRRAGQFSLFCDGQATASFPDPYSFVPLAHFWMCQHPSPRRVLVLGGIADGLPAEILRHPVERVDCVEPDPRAIDLLRAFLPEADRRALEDPRIRLRFADARYFVKTQRDRFDLVIARLPEPLSALRARLYTDEFFGELRQAMTAHAVLCMTAAAAPTSLSAPAAEYLASLRAALRRHFADVRIGWGDPAAILAATADGLVTTEPAELARRYGQRQVRTEGFDPLWFDGAMDWLAADKIAQRGRELDEAAVQVASDLHPVIYLQRLVVWERMTGGRSSRLVERLRGVRIVHVVAVLAGVGIGCAASARVRGAPGSGWSAGAISVSIASTGLVTMALSIIWLFAFQSLYGYVYQRIGWIIALFMGGLVVGSWMADRTARRAASRSRGPWAPLIAVDLLIAGLAAIVPAVLPALASAQTTPAALVAVEWVISILVAATGALCGAAFPLAAALQGRCETRPGPQAGACAGRVVGADHAGACVGALLTGLVLIPVFGIVASSVLLAGVKVASAVFLVTASRGR